jgi:hypothetical protein
MVLENANVARCLHGEAECSMRSVESISRSHGRSSKFALDQSTLQTPNVHPLDQSYRSLTLTMAHPFTPPRPTTLPPSISEEMIAQRTPFLTQIVHPNNDDKAIRTYLNSIHGVVNDVIRHDPARQGRPLADVRQFEENVKKNESAFFQSLRAMGSSQPSPTWVDLLDDGMYFISLDLKCSVYFSVSRCVLCSKVIRS